MKRLYLVVRGDLSAGQQAVQACHVLRNFVQKCPQADRSWFRDSNTLVILAVPDESALNKLFRKAIRKDVSVTNFREPDLGDSMTAVAIGPEGYRLCRDFPLALSA